MSGKIAAIAWFTGLILGFLVGRLYEGWYLRPRVRSRAEDPNTWEPCPRCGKRMRPFVSHQCADIRLAFGDVRGQEEAP